MIIAFIYNYVFPLLYYEINYEIIFLQLIFLLIYFIAFNKFTFKVTGNFKSNNSRRFILFSIFIISVLFNDNYYFSRLLAPTAILFCYEKGIKSKLIVIICIYFLSFSYSRVYLLLLPILLWELLTIKKPLRIAISFSSLFLFSSVFYKRFENILNYDFHFGQDALWLTEYVLLNYPSKNNFLYGESFLSVFFNFIPRQFWDDKPLAFGVELSMHINHINNHLDLFTNYGPGIIAESYANFWYLGIPIFAIFSAYIFKIAHTIWLKYRFINPLFFMPFIILYVRGDFLNGCLNLFILFFCLYFFTENYKNNYEF